MICSVAVRCARHAALAVLFATALLAGTIAGRALLSSASDEPPRYIEIASPRHHPLRISPIPAAAPPLDAQAVGSVLSRLAHARWNSYKSAKITHGTRLWGTISRFGDEALLGRSFVASTVERQEQDWLPYLLDSRVFADKSFDRAPLLARTPYGIAVREESSGGMDPGFIHPDQLLKTLGEIGCSAGRRIVLPEGHSGKVFDILTESLARFTLDQEMEFTAIAYSLWLPPTRSWTNRFGETFNFDDIASRLLDTPLGKGACYGCHVPYALVMLLRAHEQYPILSAANERRVRSRLRAIADCLERTQGTDGAWTAAWPASAEGVADDVIGRVTATGHHLEWLIFAPAEIRPSRNRIEKAIEYVVKTTTDATAGLIDSIYYAPFTHAARAVFLWSLTPEHAARLPSQPSQKET